MWIWPRLTREQSCDGAAPWHLRRGPLDPRVRYLYQLGMGSWAAFYVEGRSVDDVADACAAWLAEQRGFFDRIRGRAVAKTPFSNMSDGENWTLLSPGRRPRQVVVGTHSQHWTLVFYGSFVAPNALAEHVSRALACRVVDTQGQTTSDAYRVIVLGSGACTRELEFADGEWLVQEGAPLPNEPSPLEHVDEDEPDEPGWFDFDAVTAYMKHVFDIEWWQPPVGSSGVRVG